MTTRVLTVNIENVHDVDLIFGEAETLKSLNHRNIVKVINCFNLGREVAFIMEYLEGGELLEVVKKKGRLSEELAKNYFIQLIDAIAYCHREKLIHRI